MHEHTWARCKNCPNPDQPCACAGAVCCDAELSESLAEQAAWLANDQIAEAELARGEGHHFDNAEDAIRWLVRVEPDQVTSESETAEILKFQNRWRVRFQAEDAP